MKDERLYLLDILERVERIEAYTQTGETSFLANLLTQDAVIRNFEVVGEAVKRLSEVTKNRQPQVAWKEFAGFRDVLIHQYDHLNMKRVWVAIQDDLPGLKQAIRILLEEGKIEPDGTTD